MVIYRRVGSGGGAKGGSKVQDPTPSSPRGGEGGGNLEATERSLLIARGGIRGMLYRTLSAKIAARQPIVTLRRCVGSQDGYQTKSPSSRGRR